MQNISLIFICIICRTNLSDPFPPKKIVLFLHTVKVGCMCRNVEQLQSWTKVLGTVMQYSYFSVISRFPHKTVHRFRNFLAVLLCPTLYKVETRKTILDTQHRLWGEGRGWTCVNWKMPQKCKSVPRLLSMIVGLTLQTIGGSRPI